MMRVKTITVQSFVCLLLFNLPLTAQNEMTVEDAIKLGLKNNYDIQIARNNADVARNNAGQGTAAFLPILEATGNYARSTSDLETNHPFIPGGKSDAESKNAQLTLNWTLFDGFKMFADKSRFNELARLGEFQARNVIENTVVAILAAYFNLVQQEQLLDVARNARDISQTRLQKEQVRNELGGVSSTDLLNARVAFNNDEASVLNQELQVLIACKDLNILLAQEPDTEIAVKKEILISPLNLDISELQELAEKHNSGLMVAKQNKRIAEHDVKSSRSTFFPRVFLIANYGMTDRTSSNTSDNPAFPEEITNKSTDASVALNFSFNLFNGFRNKIDLQNALLEARNRELSLRNARNELSGLVREKYETFHKRMQLVQLEQQNVLAAEQNLQLQQDRFQIGSASSLEFRDAQVNLIRAQSTLIVARYQARITRLVIEQLIGNLRIE